MPKKIGLALGGGGAKGLAHIGVIKELERANIPISYIAGTSMGALVGGVYAANGDTRQLEDIFLNLQKKDIFPVSKIIRKRDGVFRNHAIVDHVAETLGTDHLIEKCKIPFRAVATDVRTGDEVVLNSGNLVQAVNASVALPIAFKPIEIAGKILMDGGFVNPVPADIVRDMGADIVIAVDVSSRWNNVYEDPHPIHSLYSMLANALSVIEYQIAKHVLEKADIVLRPNVLSFGWTHFHEAPALIRAGESVTRLWISEICRRSGYPEPKKTPLEKFMEFILPVS